jgi:small-conductance mechanosensitive channel
MNFLDLVKFENFLNVNFLAQLFVVFLAIGISYFTNSSFKSFLKKHSGKKNHLFVNGLTRVTFPVVVICIIGLAQYPLSFFYEEKYLGVAQKIFFAMVLIRLSVYFVRYILPARPWINALENLIATIIWVMVTLYIFGILPEFIDLLNDISFKVGTQNLSLLILMQAVFAIFLAILIAMTFAKYIENKLMKSEQLDMNSKVMFGKVLRIFLYFLAVVISLSSIGVNLTFLNVLGGALGVGLAFGLQNIASNYISGFIILMDKSIHIGDILMIGEHYGVVTLIRSRYTVLRKLDGVEVIIPNEKLISENIINHSFTDRKARITAEVQIGYKSSVDKAFEIMLEAAKKEKRVLKDPAPKVYLMGFGDSGIDLKLSFYILDPEEGSWELKSDIYRKIWKRFQEEGIEIPYPYRTVELINQKK